MEYISVKDIALKWGIDTSRVGRLARNGRIPGAKLVGHNWLIPEDAEKPFDERKKNDEKITVKKEEFRYPSFLHKPVNEFNPPLTFEESIIRGTEVYVHACRFTDAKRLLDDLPMVAQNRYCKIAAICYAYLIAKEEGDLFSFMQYEALLENEFLKEFPYKKEMELLYMNVKASCNKNNVYLNFKIEPNYSYHPSAIPFLTAACNYITAVSCIDEKAPGDLSLAELSCQMLENEERFYEAQDSHFSLSVCYAYLQNDKMAENHIRKALKIAFDHNLYYLPATYYYISGEAFENVLEEFPEEFSYTISEIATALQSHFVKLSQRQKTNHILSLLPKRYYSIVRYALTDLPNKTIAANLDLSESTVNNRFSEIYEMLGIKGKQELRKCFRDSIINGNSIL